MDKFDVVFSEGGASIKYHFCKEKDCSGTNDVHGYSFDKAKEVVICYLERELKTWRTMSFEQWRRETYPTEKEMNEYMAMAEDIYALEEEERFARNYR